MSESHGGSDADPRPATSETPGGADEGGQATGNPPQDDSPAADDEGQRLRSRIRRSPSARKRR